MAVANSYNVYKQQQINTSSQDRLLLMLYDGAIRFCNQAKIALEKGDFQETHNFLLKAQNIIQEFMITLNMDYEVAHNLYYLYDYFYNRLVEANITKDPAKIEEVVGFLTDLRKTWAEAAAAARLQEKTAGGVAIEGEYFKSGPAEDGPGLRRTASPL